MAEPGRVRPPVDRDRDRIDVNLNRRPIQWRDALPARAIARWLARIGVRPNLVSALGLAAAIGAGGCLFLTGVPGVNGRPVLLLAAAGLVALRLFANMIDGLLAVEHRLGTRLGDVWNDLPDRLADAVVLVGAGYAIGDDHWARDLGWLAALLAVLTAYVRVLGGSIGLRQDFAGPLAKPQRMGVLIAACLVAAIETSLGLGDRALLVGLIVIVVGSALTAARRVRRIAQSLA